MLFVIYKTMTTPVFESGQGGTITYNSVVFNVTNWRHTLTAEAFDTTNTSSENWIGHDASGPVGASGSFEAYWDSANLPTDTGTLNIRPGSVADMVLDLGTSTLSYSYSARITEIMQDNPAKGIMNFNGSFVSTGEITYPEAS